MLSKWVVGLLVGLPVWAGELYQPAGFLELPAAIEIGAVSAVEVAPSGSLYVLHRGSPPLLAFDRHGKYRMGWGEGLFQVPHGLRADRDGNIWTTDNGNNLIRQFSPDGKLLRTLNGFRAPDDLVFSSSGEIYVADNGNSRIVRLSPGGEVLAQWGRKGNGTGEFHTAHGLAIDRQDRIYVADRGNNRVQVFDRDGKFLAAWSGFGNPFGLLVVGNELLVSEGDVHKIFHLDSNGHVVTSWGGPDMLKLPHLMALGREGTLYIAEVNGKRVQKFRRAP